MKMRWDGKIIAWMQNGASHVRAWAWYQGVIFGRGGDPDIADGNPEQVAP